MFDYNSNKPVATKGRVKKLIFETEPIPNADIHYELGYMNGEDFVRLEDDWMHIQDDDFTDLYQAINAGSNLKNTIQQFLQTKLGI